MSPFPWPAFGLEERPLPASLEYERGVWGKVHGAPTDFRWIAQSRGFSRDRPDLHAQLNLGGENVPALFQSWRNLGDRCCAVNAYRSRASDAAGRSGFLEKQILEWRRPPGIPSVLGALVFLPHVAKMSDSIWWDRDDASAQIAEPGFILPIPRSDYEPLEVEEAKIAETIERGRQALQEAVAPDYLEQLYDQLLSGRQPAYLLGVTQPLPPEALAALLLPLPRDIADRISLAGWIPSSRPSWKELGSRWDVLVISPDESVPSMAPPSQPKAREMAESLVATAPRPLQKPAVIEENPLPTEAVENASSTAPASVKPFRPGLELDLTPPEPNAPPVIRELYRFAVAPERRWLPPELLKRAGGQTRFPADSPAADLLFEWIRQVRDQRPAYADEEQWKVKVDLLCGAAIVLVPDPSTAHRLASIGTYPTEGASRETFLPASGERVPKAGEGPSSANAMNSRIPLLLFGLILDSPEEWDALAGHGTETLRQLLHQSASCGGSPVWTQRVRDWLARWHNESRREDVQVLIGNALGS